MKEASSLNWSSFRRVWYAPCEGRFFIQSLTHIVRFLLLLHLFAIITAITTPQAPAYVESAIYCYSYTSYYYSVINYYYSYCSNKLHSVYMGYIEQQVASNLLIEICCIVYGGVKSWPL